MLFPPISSLFIQHLHCIRHLYRRILVAVLSGGKVMDTNGVYNLYQSFDTPPDLLLGGGGLGTPILLTDILFVSVSIRCCGRGCGYSC